MTTSRPYIESHTALRGIAAVVVVIDHLCASGQLPNTGWWGRLFQIFAWNDLAVFLFFILSGFVMSYVYPSPVRWSSFFVARLARLVPVYEVTLWFVLVMVVARPGQSSLDASNLVANLLMIQQWPPVPGWDSINFPSWSLSVEALLYVAIFPLLIMSRGRSWSRVLYVALTVVGVTWGAIYYNYFASTLFLHWHLPLLSGLFGFSAGFAIQSLMSEKLRFPSLMAAIGFSIVGVELLRRVVFPESQGHGLLMLGFVLVVVASADPGGWPYRLLARPFLLYLGDISYSLYLWHFPVILFLMHAASYLAPKFHATMGVGIYAQLVTVAILISAFSIATASYYWLEVPFRRLIRDRFVRPNPGMVAVAT